MPAPPPRSERSRSPSRSAYGRPAYSDPYADPYRDHWDTYNRDRAWADYERDRGSYDHGRRGRSRSPPPDDSKFHICKHAKEAHNPYTAGRKRRRSASPYERERYDPRPRYEDYGEPVICLDCREKSKMFLKMVTVATATRHHEGVDMVMDHVLDVGYLHLTRIPWIIQRL